MPGRNRRRTHIKAFSTMKRQPRFETNQLTANCGKDVHPSPQLQQELARYAADLGAEHLQFLFDALVTTVDVVDTVDQGVAFGNQG